MFTMIVTFLNQKGGVGKSTVCILLGAVLKAAGYKVSFDDRDPQQSVSQWAKEVGGIPLKDNCPDADIILCDTPGRLDLEDEGEMDALRALVQRSDRLLMVCEKSPFSIQASKAMCAFTLSNKSENAKAYLLFNKIRQNTVIGKQENNKLAEGLGLAMLTNALPLAAPYENIQLQGISAIQGKHREIILKLALEVLK